MKSWLPDGAEAALCGADDLAGVGGRHRQLHHTFARVLRVLRAERVGLHEYHQPGGREILPAQFLGRTRGVVGDDFLHIRTRCYQAAKRTCRF